MILTTANTKSFLATLSAALEVLRQVHNELDSPEHRKEEAEKLLLKPGTAALHDYIILRFGRDPILAGVMNKDMLWGLIHRLDTGTSGCLLVAKNQEAWEMAKKDSGPVSVVVFFVSGNGVYPLVN